MRVYARAPLPIVIAKDKNNEIDDLIKLTEHGLPLEVNPNTDQLVQAMQRYDAIFRLKSNE